MTLKFLNVARAEHTQPSSGHTVRGDLFDSERKEKRVDPRSTFPVIEKPRARKC